MLGDLKLFNGANMQAWEFFSVLNHYFIIVRITIVAAEAADMQVVYQYMVLLMRGNAIR